MKFIVDAHLLDLSRISFVTTGTMLFILVNSLPETEPLTAR